MCYLHTRSAKASDLDFIDRLHRQTFSSSIERQWGQLENIFQERLQEEFESLRLQIISYANRDIGVISTVKTRNILMRLLLKWESDYR